MSKRLLISSFDFDQILAVTVGGPVHPTFTADELSLGIRVSILGRANKQGRGTLVTGQVQLAGTQAAQPLELEAGIEFYFEEGELRLPMTVDLTPEKRAAGF